MRQNALTQPALVVFLTLMLFVAGVHGDLIAIWKFDGNATDSSPNAQDGTLVDAGFSDDTPSVLGGGQALSLAGGAHIEVPHSDILNFTQAITISAFVKPAGNSWEGIIAKNPSTDSPPNHAGNFELRVTDGSRALGFLYQRGGVADTMGHAGGNTIVETDVWSHVAVSADISTGDIHFYLNGELTDSFEDVLTLEAFPLNENPLYIGSRADLFTGFDGLIDELSIWNEALQADEIALLASGPVNVDGAPDSDQDGIPDFFENRFGFLNPNNAADGAADQDGDGLSNAQEFAARTNLESGDTDGDSLGDGAETNTGVYVSLNDTGTNPRLADSDGDGLPDGVENNSQNFVNAANPGTNPVNADTDADGFGDFVEVTLGSNPLDPQVTPSGIVLAKSAESWAEATAWTDGQVPTPGKNYLVVGSVAPVLESPTEADPSFGGDRLDLIGMDTSLLLRHSGVASMAALGVDGGLLAKVRTGNSTLGLPGQTLTFTQASRIELRQPGILSIGSEILGGSALTVSTAGETTFASNGFLQIEHSNERFTGDWTVSAATLKGRAVNSLGRGDIILQDGVLDLDYNLNNVTGKMDISGEESRIVLDQTLAFGEVTINDGAIAVPDGVYDYDALGALFDGGLQFIFLDGGGRLIIGGDSDSDGLPDAWEQEIFASLDQTSDGDDDQDGLTNAQEFVVGSDPANADSDSDGVSDGDEVKAATNPNAADTDGDGLADGVETRTGNYVSETDTGTDPNIADSDGDGLGDAFENNSGNFASAENPGTDPNNRDTDGDGASDGQEVRNGTDPHDPSEAILVIPGTVGLWTFEADLPVQPDLSGNGNDAKVMGATWVNDPERGGVMSFQGEAYLEAEDSDSLSLVEDLTIAAWIKVTDFGTFRGIVAKTDVNRPAPYDLYLVAGSGIVRFYSGSGPGALASSDGMTVPETGVWQHLAVTYEGNTVTHYLNGQINGQTDISTLREDTDGTFRIGNRADLVTQFLGLMDDVVMMNRAATDAEVLDLMAGGLGGGDPTPPDGGGGFAISEVRVDEGGNLQATFNSLPDNVYVAEFSTNLIDWSVTVDDIASDGDLTTVRQPRPEAPAGFIRIRLKE